MKLIQVGLHLLQADQAVGDPWDLASVSISSFSCRLRLIKEKLSFVSYCLD